MSEDEALKILSPIFPDWDGLLHFASNVARDGVTAEGLKAWVASWPDRNEEGPLFPRGVIKMQLFDCNYGSFLTGYTITSTNDAEFVSTDAPYLIAAALRACGIDCIDTDRVKKFCDEIEADFPEGQRESDEEAEWPPYLNH